MTATLWLRLVLGGVMMSWMIGVWSAGRLMAASESADQDDYVVPTSPPLYEKAPGYRIEQRGFAFGLNYIAGRAIPSLDKRAPGPAHLIGIDGEFSMGTPLMSEWAVGIEWFMGKFYFSTGELSVTTAIGLNASYRRELYGQLKLGSQLSFGQTYGRYVEVVDQQTLSSGDDLVYGNYGKFEVAAYLSPLKHLEFSSGLGYGYFSYLINQSLVVVTASTDQQSAEAASVPKLPSDQLQLHVPYMFLAAAYQL